MCGTKLSTAVLFPRSGDVIYPQLWESGSGYETTPDSTCTHTHTLVESAEGVHTLVSYPDPNVLKHNVACYVGRCNQWCMNSLQ